MRLTRRQLDQLIRQARADAPNETCGLMGGKDRRALAIYPLENVDETPRVRFRANAQQLFDAITEIEGRGWDLLGIYHSHPASPAFPSETDVAQAFYPEAIYLVISLMAAEQTIVRAFRIVEGRVSEITLEIEDSEDESS